MTINWYNMSIVRGNLMNRPYYTPYCGNELRCSGGWPRTIFNGEQFRCPVCGWKSDFDAEFIDGYKFKWGKS